MKKLIFAVALAMGAATAALTWADALFWTDAETGFLTAGNPADRYLLAGLLLVVAVSFSFAAPRVAVSRPRLLSTGVQALLILSGAAFGLAGLFGFVSPASGTFTLQNFALAALELVSAAWFGAVVVGSLAAPRRQLPGGVALGILAAMSVYLLTVQRFMLHQTGTARVGFTMRIFTAAAGVVFFSVLLRALLFPKTVERRAVTASGLAAFWFSTCIEGARTAAQVMQGGASGGELATSAALAALGLLGLFAAGEAMQPLSPAEEP